MNAISLFELNNRIRQALKGQFAEPVWITAEITEIQNNSSGHCYLQLADKKEGEDAIIATARGTIWAFTYRMLRPYFETTTGRCLAKGMKVLVNAEVVFHEVYGYSLNIKDIDPTFTIGDLERKRREIIARLEEDGIIDMNRELEFPALPKNVAVISSPTAAGLGDFMDQLGNNPYGYRFHVKLFPAVMQGDKTTDSVIAALERIYEYEAIFDVVVIIRGGGSQTDLGSFDSYDMAANVAQFPLPVIAGIGHERDETIVDRVANMRVKTPTAAASFLIGTFQEQEARLGELKNDFGVGVTRLLHDEKTRQMAYVSGFRHTVKEVLGERNTRLKLLSQQLQHSSILFVQGKIGGFERLKARIGNYAALLFSQQKNRLENFAANLGNKSRSAISVNQRRLELAETTVKFVDPVNVLERGYSITLRNGKAVKDVNALEAGDVLTTRVAKGKIESIVERVILPGKDADKERIV